jgi:dTDP-4-amino-4,6-dideoxy-D-galactose acyltransferase
MPDKIKHLSWDSRFFGYPVAKICLTTDDIGHLRPIFEKLTAKNYRLAYFFTPPEQKGLNNRILEMGGILADQKVTYMKQTEKQIVFKHQIEEYQEKKIDDRLKSLVLQAGEYSRFRTDKAFVNNEFSRLYIEWLRKSINKTIARKTLVVKRDFQIAGFITLGEKAGKADIGLVAVDGRYRGLGIGNDLIRSADGSAHDMGLATIQVVTQMRNRDACRIYEKCGFKIHNIVNVYHYWSHE